MGPGAVVGVRAALLPGSRIGAGGSLGALELSMKAVPGMGTLDSESALSKGPVQSGRADRCAGAQHEAVTRHMQPQ